MSTIGFHFFSVSSMVNIHTKEIKARMASVANTTLPVEPKSHGRLYPKLLSCINHRWKRSLLLSSIHSKTRGNRRTPQIIAAPLKNFLIFFIFLFFWFLFTRNIHNLLKKSTVFPLHFLSYSASWLILLYN